MWSFVAGCFHLAEHFQCSPKWEHGLALHSSLWLNIILLYGHSTCCFSIHILMAIQAVFTFSLLKQCCCEDLCTSFCADLSFHFSWVYIYLEVELLGNYMFKKLPNCFFKVIAPVIFPLAMQEDSSFSTPLPILVILYLFYERCPSGCRTSRWGQTHSSRCPPHTLGIPPLGRSQWPFG